MYHYSTRRFCKESKTTPSTLQLLDSSKQQTQSVLNMNNCHSTFHIDRLQAKKHYDCFPEYAYNTAFGSLLTGFHPDEGIRDNELKVNNEQYLLGNLSWPVDDCCLLPTHVSNSSTWNNVYDLQQPQSIQNMIRILVDFLDEFLLYLTSIIECAKSPCQFQLQHMRDVAERIYELRSKLLTQISNTHGCIRNSTVSDLSSISLILHELASCIHSLGNEQQQTETIIEQSQTNMFSQLLNRLERVIQSCLDCIARHSHPQNHQPSIPILASCLNSPHVINNPILPATCSSPCDRGNTCMPWSVLEQLTNSSESDHVLGLVYGIKDKRIRRKLGYGVGERQSSSRTKQGFSKRSKRKHRRNTPLNKEDNFDSHRQWITSSSNDQIRLKETEKKSGRISPNSIVSRGKLPSTGHASNRTLSRQQSIVNSKRSSLLSNGHSNTGESIRLHSIHDRLIVSNSSGRMTPQTESSHRKELRIPSTTDHGGLHRTSSGLSQQQQSNISKEDDRQSALSSPLSFQTDGYRTPSKTTYQMTRASSQSLSPSVNESIGTHRSRESRLSPQNSSINDVKETKSTLSIAPNDDQQSPHDNPISYDPHAASIDSSMKFNSWEQRLATPVSMTSAKHYSNTALKQNTLSPISNELRSINKTTSDFNFDNYSEQQISPSTSFRIETKDTMSPLIIIEGPQSAEGEKKTWNNADDNKDYMSTPYFSPKNVRRQRSTSATSDSESSSSDRNIKEPNNQRHSFRLTTEKIDKFRKQKTSEASVQLNKQGYLNKFRNCFRRTIADPIDRSKYKNK